MILQNMSLRCLKKRDLFQQLIRSHHMTEVIKQNSFTVVKFRITDIKLADCERSCTYELHETSLILF